MLSLGDLLRDLDVRVLCGQDALSAPVRWVHISELSDPTPFLSGGELLLTTGLGLGSESEQRAYVRRLAEHGLAGLGVGVGFGLDTVPAPMVEEAQDRGFTLFEIPYELPFIALTEKAFVRLVNEQYAVLQRSIATQERLQRIVLSGGGLDAVAQATAGLIAGSVLVFDPRGELTARHGFQRGLDEEVISEITGEVRERAQRGGARGFVPAAGELAARGLALPVAAVDGPVDARPQAWIVGIKDGEALGEFDRLVLHQAVTASAIELLRRRVAGTTERRLAGDVLAAMVSGELVGEELARRLAPFGLGGHLTALVLRAEGRKEQVRLEPVLSDALEDEAVSALVASVDGTAVALMPGYLDDELLALAERLHGRVARALGAEPAAGVG
nr:PucR family transcriptional regulator ligand-binding domain-containing protein [Solirubrobacterales bacterium]